MSRDKAGRGGMVANSQRALGGWLFPLLLAGMAAWGCAAYAPYSLRGPPGEALDPDRNPIWQIAFLVCSLSWFGLLGATCVLALRAARQRRRFEAGLREQKQFAESLLAAAPVIVLVLDPEGRVVYGNPCLEQTIGYRLDEIRGTDWIGTCVPELDRPDLRQLFRQMVSHRDSSTTAHSILARGNTHREIEWYNRRLKDAAGRTAGVLAVGREITDLKKAQPQAVQAQRLAAIGQVVAGLAHESRNALQRSQACLEMLELELQDRPKALDLAYRIQIAQDDLCHLHEEVQQYAAPMVLRREPANLTEVLEVAWDHLKPLWTARTVQMHCDPWPTEWVCHVDRRAMQGVFRNVLENSLAACADPVKIDVTWAAAELEGRPSLRISLRDNGPGVEGETRQRIFEPFYTTKTHGTGLGMAIAQRIVEAHGGGIAVGPAEEGAEILIALPRE